MVTVIEGDIFEEKAPWGVLLHQVNCLGIADGGIAKEFKDRFPEWFDAYSGFCETGPEDRRNLLGRIHFFKIGQDTVICSAFGQYDISKRRTATDYGAWKAILTSLRRKFEEINANGMNWEIRAPYGIGCGLGGGDWRIMRGMIDDEFAESPVRFVLYRLPTEKRTSPGRDMMESKAQP